MSGTNRGVILVTGCSSGIGRHCAIRLREAGWRVFATARKPTDVLALDAAGLEGLHLEHADSASVRGAFARVMAASGGRLDALFLNGAYGLPGAVEDISREALTRQFEANVFGWHELANLAVPVMRAQGAGRIVHCSSVLGVVPYPWRGAYTASKFAIEALAMTMRMELRGSGVHVSLIEPGPIASRFNDNALAHFMAEVDRDASPHRAEYERQLTRLRTGGGVNRFRLEPEAVWRALARALGDRSPRLRYPVTVPAHAALVLRRLLPDAWLERFLLRYG